MSCIPEELIDNDLIFHFTKPYVAMENILYEKRIRFSSLNNMNDPYEYKILSAGLTAWGDVSQKATSETLSRLRDTILYKSKILSLVRSKEIYREDDYSLVFTKPRLWAQYAEAQYGVCLIFSLSACLEKIKKSYPELTVYHNFVNYDLSSGKKSLKTHLRYAPPRTPDENIRHHIKVNQNDIFFRKYQDFGDEAEYRIVLIDWNDSRNNDLYIDIQDMIRGVILGERFHAIYEEPIKNLVKNLNADLYRIYYASNIVLEKLNEQGHR